MREIHLAPNCGCIQRQGVLCMPHMERNPRNAVATMVLHCIHTPTSCKKVPFICECLVNVIVNEFPLNSGCARNWISICTTYRICTEFPCIHSVPITLHSYFSFGTPSRVFFSCNLFRWNQVAFVALCIHLLPYILAVINAVLWIRWIFVSFHRNAFETMQIFRITEQKWHDGTEKTYKKMLFFQFNCEHSSENVFYLIEVTFI